VEGKVGWAFNGGPATPPPQNKSFLPIHLEGRGKYWFGRNVFSRKGLRPYVALGGGLAQVDVKLPTTVVDCLDKSHVDPATNKALPNTSCLLSGKPGNQITLDAYRKLGQGFVTIGGGAMYAFGKNHGLVLNLSFMYMLPSSGVVFEPTVGYAVGL
jgi:hypothetical protein